MEKCRLWDALSASPRLYRLGRAEELPKLDKLTIEQRGEDFSTRIPKIKNKSCENYNAWKIKIAKEKPQDAK